MDWDALDPLFEGRPDAFVAARNALAKDLRAAGDKAAAAEVAKLRRPTPTAYALNQLARHQPDLLAAALEARAALRDATEGVGRGEDADLREATAADRAATRAVVAAARDVLGAEDAGLAQRVTGTLLAAVLDDQVGAALRAGRLTAEQDASALAFATGDEVAPVVSLADQAAKRAARSAPPKGSAEGRGGRDAQHEGRPSAAERAAAAKAERAAAKAAEEAERARRRERAEREQAVERLERRVRRLDGKLAEAEGALAAARDERDAAQAELDAARAALDVAD